MISAALSPMHEKNHERKTEDLVQECAAAAATWVTGPALGRGARSRCALRAGSGRLRRLPWAPVLAQSLRRCSLPRLCCRCCDLCDRRPTPSPRDPPGPPGCMQRVATLEKKQLVSDFSAKQLGLQDPTYWLQTSRGRASGGSGHVYRSTPHEVPGI